MSEDSFDPYYTWLAIPPDERPINHYRLLGIAAFEENPEVISNAADQRMLHIRTLQTGKRASHSQKILNELSAATVCLLDPDKKEHYDRQLRQSGSLSASSASDGSSSGSFMLRREQIRVVPSEDDDGEELKLAPVAATERTSADAGVAGNDRSRVRTRSLTARSSAAGNGAGGATTRAANGTARQRMDSDRAKQHPRRRVTDTTMLWRKPSVLIGAGAIACAAGMIVILLVISWSDRSGDDRRNTARGEGVVVENPAGRADDGSARTAAEGDPPDWTGDGSAQERVVAGASSVAGASTDTRAALDEERSRGDERPGETDGRISSSTSSDSSSADIDSNRRVATVADGNDAGRPESAGGLDEGEIADGGAANDLDRPDIGFPDWLGDPDPGAWEPKPVRGTRPVPDRRDVAEAAKMILDLYQEPLAEAKSLNALAELADRFHEEAGKSSATPAEHFALLDIASDLATRSGRRRKAWTMLDEMERHYQIDVIARKAEALTKSIRRIRAPYEMKIAAKDWIQLVEEAVVDDRYDLARDYAIEANKMALKSFDKDFRQYVNHGLDAIQQLLTAYQERSEDHQAYLASLPAGWGNRAEPPAADVDSAAVARWGRFLCVYKNDWDQGLPLWRRGDGPRNSIVELDLARPEQTSGRMEVADLWWEAADSERDILPRRFLKQRAAHWYRRAHERTVGLERRRSETRLREVESDEFSFERGKAIGLSELIDPDAKGPGGWIRRGSRLVTADTVSRTRLVSPVTVDGDYELQVLLTRESGESPFSLVLPVGLEKHATLTLGDKTKGLGGIESMNARQGGGDASAPDEIENGRQHCLRVRVNVREEYARIIVWLDGYRHVRWLGEIDSLPGHPARGKGIEIHGDPGNSLVLERLQLSLLKGEALPVLESP